MKPGMNFKKLLKRSAQLVNEYRDASLLRQSDLFDKKWYREKNPDVPEGAEIQHFLRFGGKEGRAPSEKFDAAGYLEANKDVAYRGLNPLVHYLKWGKEEGRKIAISRPAARASLSGKRRSAPSVDLSRYSKNGILLVTEQEIRDLELLHETDLFDAEWYLENYPHLKNQDPYLHFLRHGGFEGLKASENFDCEWYCDIYPDVVLHGVHPLLHYLKHGMKEGRFKGMPPKIASVVKRTVADLMVLDPEIESCHPLHGKHLRLRPNFSIPTDELGAAWTEIFHDLPAGIRHVVFMPWLVKGGADLAGVNILRAAQEAVGVAATLLVLTDHDKVDAFDWLPSGSQVLVLSDYDADLNPRNRQRIVEALIFTLQPESITNVNSSACWAALVEKGKAFQSICKVYTTLFCRDFTEDGRGAGYADTHLRAAIHNVDKIYFDTNVFLEEVVARYGFTPALTQKLQFLPQPALDDLREISKRSASDEPRPAVFWAGRFCHQKNTELLGRIIRSLPEVTLDVYGGGEPEREAELAALAGTQPKLRLLGMFASFSKLPLERYAAFLFTSRFEGMPTVLINAAAAGVPIIASNVGGVSELVTNDTGWLIDALDDERAYCAAIQEILDNPEEVERRLQAMRKKLGVERSWSAFKAGLPFSSMFSSEAEHV